MRTAGSAVLTMMKIGTMAQRISRQALGPLVWRKVAIEWIMTANTAAATNPQIHRIGASIIVIVNALA